MQWYEGQKVVCVNGRFPIQIHDWADHRPEEGTVYTIRRIGQAAHGLTGQLGQSLLLVEIVNPEYGPGREIMFSADRFRPLTRSHQESTARSREEDLVEA